ncbi:hypothetical protein ACFXCZ_26580 [Streptomyces sp. NPDC059396]|uniref:hypothetical protein n=1 Tax=Streptomyces sp. NPDC059396 TaxID=3346819 RepID=UPI0036883FD0
MEVTCARFPITNSRLQTRDDCPELAVGVYPISLLQQRGKRDFQTLQISTRDSRLTGSCFYQIPDGLPPCALTEHHGNEFWICNVFIQSHPNQFVGISERVDAIWNHGAGSNELWITIVARKKEIPFRKQKTRPAYSFLRHSAVAQIA